MLSRSGLEIELGSGLWRLLWEIFNALHPGLYSSPSAATAGLMPVQQSPMRLILCKRHSWHPLRMVES